MAKSLFAAMGLGVFLSTSAFAQMQIDPRCAHRHKDENGRIRCTCAMQNGGYFNGDGSWSVNNRQAPAWLACLQKNGLNQ